MKIDFGYGVIDTSKEPFGDDKKLIACCKRCEAYSDEEHDFRNCINCPVLSLYKNYIRAMFQVWHGKLGKE